MTGMTGDPGEIVRAGYDRVAARYRALEHDGAQWPRAEWIEKLTSRLRPGVGVLDLGCAAGIPVVAELAKRYRVTGVDISPEHIRQAAGNVPDAEFICSEAIVSLYTFDHIPRDDNDEPGIVAEWLGADMYFSMFGADATRQLVRDTGFDIEETALGTQTEGDIAISYTWILARKPSSAI